MIYINGQVSTKEEYLRKMSQNAINGGLWGDFYNNNMNIPIFANTKICVVYNKCSNNDEYNLENENLQMEGESQEWTSFKDLTYKKENTDCHEIPLDICI
jgi:hypothetical protein